MLKLQPIGTEPEWKAALGTRFLFAPITRPVHRRGQRAAREAIRALPDGTDEAKASEAMGDAMSEAILMECLLDWEGVGDADGSPVACTPDRKAELLADPVCFDALDTLHVMPFARRVAEGNGWQLSLNGTGAGAMPEADIAGSSPATPPSEAGATSVPIASTSP